MRHQFKSAQIKPGLKVDVNVPDGKKNDTALIEMRLSDNVLCVQLTRKDRLDLVDLLLHDTGQVRYEP